MGDFLWFKDNVIAVPGVSGTHEFLHISDTHVSAVDSQSTAEEAEKAASQEKAWDSVKEDFARHFGEPFGDAQRIPSPQAFSSVIEYASSYKPKLLLMSGDILDYPHPAGARLLKRELAAYGGKYMCVPGNHERNFSDETLISVMPPESVQVYRGNGFNVVGIDNSAKRVSEKQLCRLKEVCAEGVPVILLMHIPISTPVNSEDMKMFSDYFVMKHDAEEAEVREFISFVSSDTSNIYAVLCGHVHGYSKSFFALNRPQICASSGMIGFVNRVTVKGTP